MKPVRFWYALCHVNIIISLMFIVFYFIDRVNPAMEFMDSTLSKGLLFAFCVSILIASILNARYLFLLMKRRALKALKKAGGDASVKAK